MAKHPAPLTPLTLERRRVLVAATDEVRQRYLVLRAPGLSRTWEILEADSFERARFVLQMDQCDVLLLDDSLFRPDDDGLPWLLAQHRLAALFVADATPAKVVAALQQGATQWLPRELAWREPAVLSETLHQVAMLADWQRRSRVASEALQDARRQTSRLVSLLWEATPSTGGPRWFTQRHMLERLAQEVSRCERQSGPLSVVLGEVTCPLRTRLTSDESHELAAWLAERITLSKRRCDVAGQYGPHGFMMLLPGSTTIGAVACCRRIQALLESMKEAPPPVPHPQIYFGVSTYSSANASVKALLSRAEERLEQARSGEGERVVA